MFLKKGFLKYEIEGTVVIAIEITFRNMSFLSCRFLIAFAKMPQLPKT
jgi:hypothetical protein